MMNVRAASERDLAAMYAVYYLNEVGEAENISPLWCTLLHPVWFRLAL